MARIQLVSTSKYGYKMIAFFKNRLNHGAVRIMHTSFLIGSFIFLGYLAYPVDAMLFFGVGIWVLFNVIHVLLIAILFLNTLIHYRDYEENLTALIIAAVNVALSLLYIYLNTIS